MKLIAKLNLPIKTISEANDPSPRKVKWKRHLVQKYWIKVGFKNEFHMRKPKLPVHIKLIRYAPGLLDAHDNLPMAFKWVFDEICSQLIPGLKAGRADDDKRITVEYHQIKDKSFHIAVEFWEVDTNSLQSLLDANLCQEISPEVLVALRTVLCAPCCKRLQLSQDVP